MLLTSGFLWIETIAHNCRDFVYWNLSLQEMNRNILPWSHLWHGSGNYNKISGKKMFAVIAYIIRRLIDSYLMPQITYTTGVLITLIPETLCSVRVLWEYFQLKLFFSVSSPWGQNWHCTYTPFISAHGKNTFVSILSFLCYNLRSPVEIPTGMQSEWRWTTNNENFKYSPKESSG